MATTTERVLKPQAPGAPAPTFSVPLKKRIPYWVTALLRNPVSIVGTIIVIFFIAIAILAPVLAPPKVPSLPYNIPRVSFLAEPQAPGPDLPFGTTPGGYDLYYGVIWGTRTAFQVGLIVTALTVVIGGIVGAVSAYVGGWFDEIVQRIVEIVLAFPFLMAALTLAVVL